MAKSKTETKSFFMNTLNRIKQKPTFGKSAFFLSALTALSLLIGCTATTKTDEPKWNDMYEVRQYQIETVTNEIVTTVFIAKYVETNKVVKAEKEVKDFGGYEFEPVGKDINAPTNGIEFQCTDGSCEVR